MAGRSNREILTGGKKYHNKQVKKYGVDEIVFNKESRTEYLTGFHKRKVERQKKAKSFHEEQERQARISERKKNREAQQQEFEEKLKEIEMAKEVGLDRDDEADEKWNGFESDNEATNAENEAKNGTENNDNDLESEDVPLKGILQSRKVYKIDDLSALGNAVVDEETTVTVEDVDNPLMNKVGRSLAEIAKLNRVNLNKSKEVLDESIERAKKYAVICGVSKPVVKTKKKKFRYLTKGERKENNRKVKLSKLKSRNRDKAGN